MKRLRAALIREDASSDSGDSGDSDSGESNLCWDEVDVPANGRCPQCGEDAGDCWESQDPPGERCEAPWHKRRRRA
jgi:hypothetical protein